MFVVSDEAGFVAPFPERPCPVVTVVDMTHITPPERLHDPADRPGGARGDQQVDMMGHQDIRMHGAVLAHGDLAQIVEIASVVLIGEEAGLPVVAALDHVLRQIGDVGSGQSWHEGVCNGFAGHAEPANDAGLSTQAISACRKSPC